MHDVSSVLTKKNYGRKNPLLQGSAFRQPRWMELLGVLLFAVAGLGEGKSINAVLGGLPKAVTLGFVGLAVLEFFIRGDFDRVRRMAGPSGLYILYLGVLAAWSMFIWVHNFTVFTSITRGVEKILYQSIATVVAICCVYLYGQVSIDLFTIGICIANLMILFSEVPAYGVGESVVSLMTSILSLGNNTYGYAERLEIHEVTFLEGMLLLYYLFYSPKETKQQRKRNWILAGCTTFFILAGMKRILIPALFISAAYIWILRKCKNADKLVLWTGIAWVVLFWVYLIMVHYGYVSLILNKLGINMMGRDYIWGLAKQYYTFSPTFIGLGFEAVDAMVTQFYQQGLIDVAYPLHNDILKVFVELGFPGLCFWCAFLYIVLPVYWTKKYGMEAGILYFAILNPLSMTYLTDNTAFYFWCTMGLRMIPLAVFCTDRRLKKQPKNRPKWQPPSAQQMQSMIQEERYRKGAYKL